MEFRRFMEGVVVAVVVALLALLVYTLLSLLLTIRPQDSAHTITLYTHSVTLYCRTVKPDQRIAYDCLGGNVTRFGAVVLGADDTYALADGSASDNAGGQK